MQNTYTHVTLAHTHTHTHTRTRERDFHLTRRGKLKEASLSISFNATWRESHNTTHVRFFTSLGGSNRGPRTRPDSHRPRHTSTHQQALRPRMDPALIDLHHATYTSSVNQACYFQHKTETLRMFFSILRGRVLPSSSSHKAPLSFAHARAECKTATREKTCLRRTWFLQETETRDHVEICTVRTERHQKRLLNTPTSFLSVNRRVGATTQNIFHEQAHLRVW